MINLVEDTQVADDIERPDPEEQAGRALRRLRLSRGWSQEEVARRMRAYGYDFHQTMIAKIEGAQRPLRVRELADFAALYGAEVNDLIYSPSSSLDEVTRELGEVELLRSRYRQQAEASLARVTELRNELTAAEDELYSAEGELAALDARVQFLRREMKRFSELDLLDADTAAKFLEKLRRFKASVGNPNYEEIAMRAGSPVRSIDLSGDFASSINVLPPLDYVRVIVMGCGGTREDLAAFTAAWHRIHSAEAYENIRSVQD